MTTVPVDQTTLLQKFSSGTAFQANVAQADLASHQAAVDGVATQLFDTSDTTFQTVSPTIMAQLGSSDIIAVKTLGTAVAQADTSLGAFGDHLDSQLTALPTNLNIFANHNNIAPPTNCTTKADSFFGSLLGTGSTVLGGISSIFSNISSLISSAIMTAGSTIAGIVAFVKTQLGTLVASIVSQVQAAAQAISQFIQAEVAQLQTAISDLINNAAAGLFPSVFKDNCVQQVVAQVGNGITVTS